MSWIYWHIKNWFCSLFLLADCSLWDFSRLLAVIACCILAFVVGVRFLRRNHSHRSTAVLFLCIGAGLAAGLIWGLFSARSENLSYYGRYIDTGVTIQETSYQYDTFTIGDTTYTCLPFYGNTDRHGEAVANWDNRAIPVPNPINILLGTADRGNYYTLPNEPQLDLLCSDHSGDIYCSAQDYDAAMAWYSDVTHYHWYRSDSYVYDFSNADDALTLPPPEQEAFSALTDWLENEAISASFSPSEAISAAGPVDSYILYAISEDGIVTWQQSFYLIDHALYYAESFYFFNPSEKSDPLYVPLPDDLNDDFLNLLQLD